MPKVQPLTVVLTAPHGQANSAGVTLRTWERSDGVHRGLIWGGAIALVGVVMIPIPIIHFFSPVVLLFMAPLGGYMIYRLHARGQDLFGNVTCPACGDAMRLAGSAERFPLSCVCFACKTSVAISPKTEER